MLDVVLTIFRVLTVPKVARVLFLASLPLVFGLVDSQAAPPSYFPTGGFQNLDSSNYEVPAAWDRYLASFDEPALFNDHSLKFAVRLTVAPAYLGGMVVRIYEKKDGRIFGIRKQVAPHSTNIRTSAFAPAREDLLRIKQIISNENFEEYGNHQAIVVSDGQSWLLEVRDHGDYHVAYSDGPAKGAIKSVGVLVQEMAVHQ